MDSDKKNVFVYKNGLNSDTLLIEFTGNTEEFYEKICAFTEGSKDNIRFFSTNGKELCNIDLIRQYDKICVSNGDDFVKYYSNSLANMDSEWVTLNVGGKCFTTSKRTLISSEPTSMLARMFSDENSLFSPSSRDKNGAYLIDRSPTYFEPILNYLRCGQLIYDKNINPEGILEEARFFGIESVIPILEHTVNVREPRDKAPLTRRDVIDALIKSPKDSLLRFQGVSLAGADLSKLDLSNINFKYANLQGCNLSWANLSWCCLERADLSHAMLDNAQLIGVKGLRAVLEGASMKNCNFKDPAGTRAIFEGVNLKGACLEDSDMGGVNLRIANCKKANLKNCDLRSADLAGADLENCDLSGSDLHKANLRGANLKDAAFELMLTPLHMSQTIR